MLQTTFGQLVVNNALPPELRDYNRVLDKKGVKQLFQQLAEQFPDQYREVSKKISDVGRDAIFTTGSQSFGLEHMRASPVAKRWKDQLKRQVQQIQSDQTMSREQKNEKIIVTLGDAREKFEKELYDDALATGNPLAKQIASGARGNPGNLRSIAGADLLYTDHRGRVLPLPVLRSYSEGLRPYEYLAGSFGARKGVLDTKFAVGDSGFLAKQLVQLNHRLVVTDDDDDEPGEEIRGYPVDTDDVDNSGALLAQDVGDFKRNTVLTPRILKAIKASGKGRILIRSPIVGGPAGGGVFARDVGVRERGFLPQRGDFVGHAAAQSLSEGLTQGSLSSKHSGGVAGAGRPVSGFAWINQLVQSPKNFQNGATHAQFDGKITNILEAPQGGKYLFIGNEKHYVPQGLEPKVKIGDEVEAGDVMTDGIPNPSEIVHHKGIGEGRRYFVDALRAAYKNSGMNANRRNIELLSRGAINHVKVLDETDDYNPDDVISYTDFERGWRPRADAEPVSLESARDRYLERPVLHYSVGTKLRPSVLKTMKEFGVQQVMTHREPPPFEPVMVRGMAALEQDPDWITKHLGSNLKRGFLASVHRGASADTHGTSFVPALALNPSGFGREGATTAWKPPPPALPGS